MTGLLGDVRRVHEGPLFDVFRATLDGHDVAIKRIAPTGARQLGALATAWSQRNETNVFSACELGWSAPAAPPSAAHVAALLTAEHAVIARVAADWNHPGAWLACWQPDDRLGAAADAAPGARCLVLPWCEGRSFAGLSTGDQRRWFPRMLPALWRALAVCPHGDLKPDALLLDPAGFFRLLDPGVMIDGPASRRAQPGGLDFRSQLFTSNAAHYPFVAPEHGPDAPRLRRHGPLAHQLAQTAFSQMLAALRDGAPNEPATSDVIALGALYFGILAGTSLAAALRLAAPLWTGSWRDPLVRPELPDDALAALPHVLAAVQATPPERQLLASLVLLEAGERDVERMAAAVVAAIG